jgi:hypothetical protein
MANKQMTIIQIQEERDDQENYKQGVSSDFIQLLLEASKKEAIQTR